MMLYLKSSLNNKFITLSIYNLWSIYLVSILYAADKISKISFTLNYIN